MGSTGDLILGAKTQCDSLMGPPLVVGLPDEFVDSLLQGLRESANILEVRAGILVVASGGYDEVHSSAIAFRFAGSVLAWGVAQFAENHLITAAGLSEFVSSRLGNSRAD